MKKYYELATLLGISTESSVVPWIQVKEIQSTSTFLSLPSRVASAVPADNEPFPKVHAYALPVKMNLSDQFSTNLVGCPHKYLNLLILGVGSGCQQRARYMLSRDEEC